MDVLGSALPLTLGGALAIGAGLAAWIYAAVPGLSPQHWFATRRRAVALTFDDGPNPPATEWILDILRAEDVPATFYVTGRNAEHHRACLGRIIAEGHEVGNHFHTDDVLAFRRWSEVKASLDRTEALIRQAGYAGTITVRAPRLMVGLLNAFRFRRLGHRLVGGLGLVGDWTTQDPATITRRVLRRVRPGMILILHDGYDAALTADRAGTAEATSRIITALKAKDYSFLRVSDIARPARLLPAIPRPEAS